MSSILVYHFLQQACIAFLLFLDDITNAYWEKRVLVILDWYFVEGMETNSAGENVKKERNDLWAMVDPVELVGNHWHIVMYVKIDLWVYFSTCKYNFKMFLVQSERWLNGQRQQPGEIQFRQDNPTDWMMERKIPTRTKTPKN